MERISDKRVVELCQAFACLGKRKTINNTVTIAILLAAILVMGVCCFLTLSKITNIAVAITAVTFCTIQVVFYIRENRLIFFKAGQMLYEARDILHLQWCHASSDRDAIFAVLTDRRKVLLPDFGLKEAELMRRGFAIICKNLEMF